MAIHKKTRKKSSSFSLLDRVYRYLPLFLVAFAVLNIWFIYSFVNSKKEDLSGVRENVIHDVSNMYHFVQISLSNEIERVRHSNELRLRPVFAGNSPSVSNSVSSVSNVVDSSFDYPLGFTPPSRIPATFFRVCGVSYIRFADGSHYGVGDNFGFGEIQEIYRLGIVCKGRYYSLLEPSAPSVPVSLPSVPVRSIPPLPPVYNSQENGESQSWMISRNS